MSPDPAEGFMLALGAGKVRRSERIFVSSQAKP